MAKPDVELLARTLLREMSEANVELPATAARQAHKLAAALNQIQSERDAQRRAARQPETQFHCRRCGKPRREIEMRCDPQNHAYFCCDECWNAARSEQDLRDRLRRRSTSLGASRFSAGSEEAEYRLAEEARRGG